MATGYVGGAGSEQSFYWRRRTCIYACIQVNVPAVACRYTAHAFGKLGTRVHVIHSRY